MQWNGGVLLLAFATFALAEDSTTQRTLTPTENNVSSILRTSPATITDYSKVQANDTNSSNIPTNSTASEGSEQEARGIPSLTLVVGTGTHTTRRPHYTPAPDNTPRPTRDYSDYPPYHEHPTRRPYPPWPHLPPYYSYPPHYYPQPPSYYPPYYPPYRPPYGYPGYPGYGYPSYPGYGYPYYPYGTSQTTADGEEAVEAKSVKLEPTESSKESSATTEEKSAKSMPFFKFLNFG